MRIHNYRDVGLTLARESWPPAACVRAFCWLATANVYKNKGRNEIPNQQLATITYIHVLIKGALTE